MATNVSFPGSPSVGTTYTYGSTTWVWDGRMWKTFSNTVISAAPSVSRIYIDSSLFYIDTNGNSMTFTDTSTGTKTLTDLAGGAGGLWTLQSTIATRTSNTTFTIAGDVTVIYTRGLVLRWKESGTDRVGMVSTNSTYSNPNTTVTIIGDTMTSIDSTSLKYCMLNAFAMSVKFEIMGNIGTNAADVTSAYYPTESMRVIGADIQVGSAGVTNNTTIDVNKNGLTMFTTKPTLASGSSYATSPFTADNNVSITLGDRVSIDIDAVQITPAVDMYVQLYTLPIRYLNL
jgi:hypothetical protein